jgi:hypothetical protein
LRDYRHQAVYAARQLPLCRFVPNGHYETGTFSFAQYNVTPGVHKFRAFLGTDKGGTIGNAFVKYNLYK